jgi:hypothetical protein
LTADSAVFIIRGWFILFDFKILKAPATIEEATLPGCVAGADM